MEVRMAVKKCCIDNCKSCSTRKEDKGVTYHKFPKDVTLRDTWMSVSNIHTNTDLTMYVCSRHFCKNDFQIYKDSKYILRSDAVPSIFSWSTKKTKKKMESVEPKTVFGLINDDNNASTSNKVYEVESVDAIKKFIEEQEKEIEQSASLTPSNEKINEDSMDSKLSQETITDASSVIGMILCESEMEQASRSEIKNKFVTSLDKGQSSMALSVGSRVEAKDFGDIWHPAKIIEVDFVDMEVLVHYDNGKKKSDEWINISSPRLRPFGGSTVKPGPSSADSYSSDATASTSSLKEESKEAKAEEKVKPAFAIGERCLARWRDNRRFVATIHNLLESGSYKIIFDDGCHWTCKVTRLYKLKPGKEGVASGAPEAPKSPMTPTPKYGVEPGNDTLQANAYPPYHTHLFDPARDYLGSKSERREMKRKLNIKEIFNIGQKRPKTVKTPQEKVQKSAAATKPRIIRRKPLKLETVQSEVKTESNAVDAVASIIGTVNQETAQEMKQDIINEKPRSEDTDLKQSEEDVTETVEIKKEETINESDKVELEDLKPYLDPEMLGEEMKLEQFEKPDEGTHEEVIDRIKEAINKLEDGLKTEHTSSPKLDIKGVCTPKPEITQTLSPRPEVNQINTLKSEIRLEIPRLEISKCEPKIETQVSEDKLADTTEVNKEKKKLSKFKKGKKIRLLRDKKTKNEVEMFKSELKKMRKQVKEMRKQMLQRKMCKEDEKPYCMQPGEWCCKWVNGQPLGTVSEIECEVKQDASGKAPLPRRSVQVEDKRLPEGWTKHMVRRSFGNSAGKWDVVIISPENRRFHTKNEMRVYLENHPDKSLLAYEHPLTDFGVHLKLARKMKWITNTPDGVAGGPDNQLPAGTLCSTSPLVKRRSLGLKRKGVKVKNKIPKLTIKMKRPRDPMPSTEAAGPSTHFASSEDSTVTAVNAPTLEDGYVYVGSLKVQIIDNLLRCPAEGCFKNFRNNTLIQMHIKHYHRDLRMMLGATPKVLDLAYARTMPETEPVKTVDSKVIKVKIARPKPKVDREEPKPEIKADKPDLHIDTRPVTPVMEGEIAIPRSQDSPKLRQALINKPVKRPRVLLPVRRPELEQAIPDSMDEELDFETEEIIEPVMEIPVIENLDFETAICTHTVTKPLEKIEKKRKGEKKKRAFVLPPNIAMSEEEDWCNTNSDVDTRSSFPRSGTPDSKVDKAALVSSESNEESKDVTNNYMFNESGERIKIVHMKREEIINCHCGFREEDGLMVQCELCLCWQHALCHNIQREADVPEKYTCSICLNPRRGRRSARFVHDQDRLYEGLLPAARACDTLRRSHELSGNLLRIDDALHALRVKNYVATKKDHPKLYLWAKDWEQAEIQYTQEKLNSDYSDLNIMISSIGKENLPIKPDEVRDMPLDIRNDASEDDHDRFSQRDVALGSQSLLSGLLSSPGGASLDLPISTSELERLAKSVQEQECQRVPIAAPQPEAPIENSACRKQLLKHLTRCQALIDARLDSIEAQVAELESQDPSFEDDETPDYFPRTKQTIQMMMRDLETMEELGVIT